jgi:hypothetical protein
MALALLLGGCQAIATPVAAPAALDPVRALGEGASGTNFFGFNYFYDPRPPAYSNVSSPPYLKAFGGAGTIELVDGKVRYSVPNNARLVINYIHVTGTGEAQYLGVPGFYAPVNMVTASNPGFRLNGLLIVPYGDAQLGGGRLDTAPLPAHPREFKFGPGDPLEFELPQYYGWTIAGYTVDLAEEDALRR